MFEKKNAEIPKLERYDVPPDPSFWEHFPKRELPTRPLTRVNHRNLKLLLDKCRSKLTRTQIRRAEKAISDLKTGADSYQLSDLPPMTAQNSGSFFAHGELLTDKITTWIKDGFVAGPFEHPPIPGFRANPLIAVARNGKIRPVVNMSGPVGASFNDNLNKTKLEKVHMTTAKQFGYSLKEAGVRAVFSKFDIKDAYKLVPVKIKDLKLQGFYWLGKWFCESQETFGGVPSVCNFDRLGNTTATLVIVLSEVPWNSVSRTLDDFQGLGPEFSEIAEKFTRVIKDVCGFLNIPLADICPRNEKAFVLQTRGTVLGVGFDSSNLSWFLSEEKADKIVRRCLDAINSSHLSLIQTQKLMGSVNDLCQMNKFLKFFRGSGNSLLGKFGNNENILLPVPHSLREDLLVIAKSAISAKSGLPIPSRPCEEPLSALNFFSDAAGAKYALQNGSFKYIHEAERGVCTIGGKVLEDIWIWEKLVWPASFLCQKDNRGREYGRKSTLLEALGVLLPLASFPERLAGKNLSFWVDNAAVVYGWQKGYIKFDAAATMILKCVHVLSAYLGALVRIKHVPRMSNDMASLADEMSRLESPKVVDNQVLLSRADKGKVFSSLLEWLNNPSKSSSLLFSLLSEVKARFPYD